MSKLILITLPIGNHKDITNRALEALNEHSEFYAEDTRVFKDLLKSFGIEYSNKFIDSYHDQNQSKTNLIIEKIKEGKTICLVSDAGSPVISDPAYPLLKAAKEEGIEVDTLPGVTSVITALELSCLPPHPFHFWGFSLRTKGERIQFFSELSLIRGTHIFFESPHRIYESIANFFEIFPQQELVITRELTKTYQSVYRIRKEDLNKIEEIVMQKGEFVVLFHNELVTKNNSIEFKVVKDLVIDYLENGGSTKKLAKIFSKLLDEDTKIVYDKLSKK